MKKEIWKNYYDIVILPPKDVSDYTRELSRGLSKFGTKWTLGKDSFIPHISLYHIPVKPRDMEAFKKEIKATLENVTSGYLKSTEITPQLFMFDKPDWLNKLYLKIIKNTSRYFDKSYGVENYWNLDHLPKNMRKIGKPYLKKYGTPMVGRNYKPHVTLTSFKNGYPDIRTRKAKPFKFKPDSLYIYELGQTHSCQNFVAKIPFKN